MKKGKFKDPMFKVTKGETKGSKQVIFYYCSKVNWSDLENARKKHFRRVKKKNIKFYPGIVSCVMTTGDDFEVPKE